MTTAPDPQPPGKLPANIAHFARALRRAGLTIGPDRVVGAVRAVAISGFSRREDFYWTLHACLIGRPEDMAVFDQTFRLFWRDPRYLDHMMSMLLPQIRGVHDDRAPDAAEKRAAQGLLAGTAPQMPQSADTEAPTKIEIDATTTQSAEERLRTLDFEQMSTDEMAEAKRMLARLSLPVQPLPGRRMGADTAGLRVDAARTLRSAGRTAGEILVLARRTPRPRWPNLVVICDISGSMSRYSRMALHFLHAVANTRGNGWAEVHGFTFGTRLTNITRHLRTRDVDAALRAAGAQAQDWSGGTRIGAALAAFNRDWSRRVLVSGAVVLLITDGLDRDDPVRLGVEMQRLHLSARRLIWLNPLLRWDGFAPRASGIRAMLPHVDAFRAAHSIDSLAALGAAISDTRDGGEKARLLGLLSDNQPNPGGISKSGRH